MNPFGAKHPHMVRKQVRKELTCYFGDCEGISRMIFAADKKEMSTICLWTIAAT